jgi:hypothetical protein
MRLQNLISGLSGAAIGGGFGVSTWAPYLCLLPSRVASLVWAQLAMFLASFPLAAGLALVVPWLSAYFWKGALEFSRVMMVLLRYSYSWCVCAANSCVDGGLLCVWCSQSIKVCVLSSILDCACHASVCNVDGLCAHGNTWRDHCAEPSHWHVDACFRVGVKCERQSECCDSNRVCSCLMFAWVRVVSLSLLPPGAEVLDPLKKCYV